MQYLETLAPIILAGNMQDLYLLSVQICPPAAVHVQKYIKLIILINQLRKKRIFLEPFSFNDKVGS